MSIEQLAEVESTEDDAETAVIEAGGDLEPIVAEDDEDDEVVVTIGESAPPPEEEQQAPEWVRDLRKAHRETQKENRELKQKLETAQKPAEVAEVKLGVKPRINDFDYDTEKYESALDEWHEQKLKVAEQTTKLEADDKAAKDAWQAQLDAYGVAKSSLKVKDYDDAEAVIMEALNQTQQGIVVQGSDNPALVFYALGKNPAEAKEISAIKDPVKFAFAIAKLEKDLKVNKRKAPPAPEKRVTGTGPSSGTVDSTLEKLREDAAKTGNYTKVSAYKRDKRAAKK